MGPLVLSRHTQRHGPAGPEPPSPRCAHPALRTPGTASAHPQHRSTGTAAGAHRPGLSWERGCFILQGGSLVLSHAGTGTSDTDTLNVINTMPNNET